MRLAGSLLARVLVASTLMFAAAAFLLVLPQSPALASSSLTVTAQKGISLLTESDAFTVEGPAGLLSSAVTDGSEPVQIVIELSGPVGVAQVGQTGIDYVIAGTVMYTVPAADIAADGSFRSRVLVPLTVLDSPGAYVAKVELSTGTIVRANGSLWFGKVAVPTEAVDVACVWPLTLGVHRDADGVFYDRALEDAAAGTITDLATLGKSYPDWQFTLAVEPILLTQLRDMADGYVRVDEEGVEQQVGPDGESAQGAAAAISALAALAASEEREVDVTPYAAPSLGALAQKGWRDGLDQMQLGKQVAQQILALPATPTGAYASDLDITTDGLASYGQASIDHVLVAASVASSLAEPVPAGAVTARVRDLENRRVTLAFVDEQMQSFMAPPWDINLFYAGLAAQLTASAKEALVITSQLGSGIPPAGYLDAVGKVLHRFAWIDTTTVKDLVREHSPGSRPVLLNRVSTEVPGYIAEELQASVDAAHVVVADLGAAAGTGWEPVERAQSLLYTAESGWWSLPGTSPSVASVGLRYAELARTLAQAELAQITPSGFRSTSITGSSGTVHLVIENKVVYPVKVEVALTAKGLTLPDGDRITVSAEPGRTLVDIRVAKAKGGAHLKATVMAGAQVLGESEHDVGFVTVMTYVPWGLGALVLIAAVVTAVLLLRRRKGQGPKPSRRSREARRARRSRP
jgi:hypothetical protein